MHSEAREIKIVGGGLAGLSLGIALAKRGIPVQLYEAGAYPRHRVCGEFIAGLNAETAKELGIEESLSDAEQHRAVSWFREGKSFRQDRLPTPALGISRHRLDQRLARLFQDAGGLLQTNTRFSPPPDSGPEGIVWANGRSRARADWMGIKLHCRNLALHSDLEVHLGDQAYAGASAVENGRVNICALIKRRPQRLSSGRSHAFFDCLESAGLGSLAARAAQGDPDLSSQSSVAGLSFGPVKRLDSDPLRIGDAHALIPPFTGDGMAMAFEGAASVLHPLLEYAERKQNWADTQQQARRALRKRFKWRLAVAGGIHSFLYEPQKQAVFKAGSSARLLPFRPLFQMLH